MAMESSVMTVSAPLATDLSARTSVIRRIRPRRPAATRIIHIGKACGREIWSNEVAHAQFMRDAPSREQRANGQSEPPRVGNCPRFTMSRRRGPFDGERSEFLRDVNARHRHPSGLGELAFLGDALERFSRTLDA